MSNQKSYLGFSKPYLFAATTVSFVIMSSIVVWRRAFSIPAHSAVLITTPNETAAKELARRLVDSKLAACVNILPGLKSVYYWEGSTHEESEVLLVAKTKTILVEKMTRFVKKNHRYDNPEVISIPISGGSPEYLDWITKSTK